MVRISAIIPTYNRSDYLRQAIDSVLEQRDVRGGIEIVVIDDASSDDTPAVLRRYGDRVRTLQLDENVGPGAARNLGAQIARGSWLAFLDSDDRWKPDKLRRQLAMAAEGARLIYTDRDDFGENVRGDPRWSSHVILHEGDVFEPLLLFNFITLSSVLMRRDDFLALGGFEPTLPGAEDWDLWLRFAAEHRVSVCHEPLTLYRRHAGGISNQAERMAAAHLRVIRRTLALPRARQVERSFARRVYALGCNCSAWFSAPSNPHAAAAYYLRSLTYWPGNLRAVKGVFKYCLGRNPG